MKTLIALLAAWILIPAALAQQNNTAPCSAPEGSQFDFWAGDWNLSWNDTGHGTNHVEKILGGCTIQENFTTPQGAYAGKSWTVYNTNYKVWQQTWVDNAGGYISLTGGRQGDSIILNTGERDVPPSVSPTGRLRNRMVYANIRPMSFDWRWEASTDGGKSWTVSWQIRYDRRR